MRTVVWMVMKLCRWMRWPREGVENDKRIHLPVPSIPGPLTPPGPTGRSERADNPEQLPSHLYPSSYMTQGKERQRGDTIALSTSPCSEVTKWILLSPFLPPSWGCLAATQEAAPVLTAELARSCKGGNSTFPAGVEALPRGTQGCRHSWAPCLQGPAACAVSSHTESPLGTYCSLSFQTFCFSEPLISLL